ncbi:MAG: hypothetical protein JNG84_03850 [Archangium sp.]|nr:hypothetical protein [Archangium sp.]
MPVSLSDRRLSQLYRSFETKRASDPKTKIGLKQLVQLLAEVADKQGTSATNALKKLTTKGLPRSEQVALVLAGMSADEKKDLTTLLDRGTVPLDAEAKSLLQAVLGRSGAAAPVSGLKVTSTSRGTLAGTTAAGATLEAINLSAAPEGRLHLDDTMVLGKAGADGSFSGLTLSGEQKIKEGDLIRMRARYSDGSTSDWVTVAAKGVATKDTRNAAVALSRIGFESSGAGAFAITNVDSGRQISEPGAVMQFTNSRTGEKTKLTITATGGFPANAKLKGKAGDTFSVAVTDGVNNTNFANPVGKVTLPGGASTQTDVVADPVLHKDELDAAGKPKYSKVLFTGPVFSGGVKPGDVEQGWLANCYFPAAMASLAQTNPAEIQKMVKANGDGTYTVTFKEFNARTGASEKVEIVVDGDLYVQPSGEALYGHSPASNDPKKMELWYALVEKAYAEWYSSSYNEIGSGGVSSDVFEAVLGKPTATTFIKPTNTEAVWKVIKAASDANKPIAAGTHGEDKEALYTNTGVYSDHAYSVLGYEEKNGTRYVKLRNPWGRSEPAGNGADDGFFNLKLEDFVKLYDNVMYVK